MKMKFKGNTVLITGANSAIGIETTRILQEYGLQVIATCRKPNIEKLQEELGSKTLVMELDFSNPETFTQFENLDYSYLVDIAHSQYEQLVGFSKQDEVKEYFTSNLINKIEFLQIIEKKMLKNKFGRLMYISSTAAARQNPGQGFYAASKKAMEEIYLAIGIEAEKKGLSSIILRPGYIDAGRSKNFLKGLESKFTKSNLISIEEIAQNIACFLSDNMLKIAGTTITIDAGASAKKNFY